MKNKPIVLNKWFTFLYCMIWTNLVATVAIKTILWSITKLRTDTPLITPHDLIVTSFTVCLVCLIGFTGYRLYFAIEHALLRKYRENNCDELIDHLIGDDELSNTIRIYISNSVKKIGFFNEVEYWDILKTRRLLETALEVDKKNDIREKNIKENYPKLFKNGENDNA